MKIITLAVLVFALAVILLSACAVKTDLICAKNIRSVGKEYYGKYNGSVKTEWLKDGRGMRLLEAFTYVDPKGVEWTAPTGSVVDGASIPQSAWSVVGGPYEGKYRDASVIHDVACSEKLRSWESVHWAFYCAMRASGVDSALAKFFYWAVYNWVPYWEIKSELRAVLQSSVEEIRNKIQSEVGPNSQVEIIERKIIEHQPKKVDATVVVISPKWQLKESDFAKAKAFIAEREYSVEGPMSLEEIRNYNPSE